jgi:hypothetical protein
MSLRLRQRKPEYQPVQPPKVGWLDRWRDEWRDDPWVGALFTLLFAFVVITVGTMVITVGTIFVHGAIASKGILLIVVAVIGVAVVGLQWWFKRGNQ